MGLKKEKQTITTITMNEIWKDIPGFEGLYQVSNLGRVKSLPKKTWNGRGYYVSTEKILKPNTLAKGYYQVELKRDSQRCCLQVHRLVAITFIQNPNPSEYNQVNHLDGNKQNNRVDNLEWCNNGMNQRHAWATGLQKVSGKAGRPKRAVVLSKGGENKVFKSIAEATRFLGLKRNTNLIKVLQKWQSFNTVKGYKAEYYEVQ